MIRPSNRASIRNISDYSPFGVQLSERTISGDGYRYGYQGSEKDDEVKGDGNSYTTEFRQLDPRVGRWIMIDPKTVLTPWESPYVSMADNPILYNDPNGDFIPLITGLIGAAGGAIYGLATGKSGKQIAALATGGFVAGATLGIGTLVVAGAGGVAAIGGASAAYILGGSSIVGGILGNITEQAIDNFGTNKHIDKDDVLLSGVFGIPDAVVGGASGKVSKGLFKTAQSKMAKEASSKALNKFQKEIKKDLIEKGLSTGKASRLANNARKQLVKDLKTKQNATDLVIRVSKNATEIKTVTATVAVDTEVKEKIKQ